MRLSSTLFLIFSALAMLMSSCDQDLNSAKDQATIDYVVIVTDSTTTLPLDSVRVHVKSVTGDTSSYTTNSSEGRVQLRSIASSRTLFELSRRGYATKDTMDTVSTPVDSVFHRPLTRFMRIKLKALGQTLKMILVPKGIVNAKDSLVFQFNQKVDIVDGITVRLINQSQLLVDTAWDVTRTQLKIWQMDANWIRGKQYEYQISARNVAGQYFSAQGDSQKVLKGIFSIPDSSVGVDSTEKTPKDFKFAYFNSGGYYRFNETDTNSSPRPDSSSQFAMLKWAWSGTTGAKADSLLLYYKDEGISTLNWALWGSIPGFLDSTTLNFSDHYSTSRSPNGNPQLPFKTNGGKIFFRVFSKHGVNNSKEIDLDPLEFGMGPTVYANISAAVDGAILKNKEDESDSLKVEFRKVQSDQSSTLDWENPPPSPIIYLNDVIVYKSPSVNDTSVIKWKWRNTSKLLIYYKLPHLVTAATRIRVDLNGVPYLGKPIWQRNRKYEFTLP